VSTGYYALDHPNPAAIRKGYPGFWGYTSMNYQPRVVVMHTTESFADLNGPDSGAENVANWFQTNDTFALYHTLVDGDSTVRVVPAGLDGTICHTAFHAAGYNSFTLGCSMAIQAAAWPTLPADYSHRLLHRAAAEVALWCKRWNIPPIPKTKAQVDAGESGISGHGILDPGYRSDPGAGFPWADFVIRVKAAMDSTPLPPGDPSDDEEEYEMHVVRDVRGNLWLIAGDRYRLLKGDWTTQLNPMLVAWAKAGIIKTNAQGAPHIGVMDDIGWNAKYLFDVTA
jgi:hypothetical protein